MTDFYDYCIDLANTLHEKNADYGNAAAQPPAAAPWLPPEIAILVRISDKVQRLATLLRPGADEAQVSESAYDTAMDLAGYGILLARELSRSANESATEEDPGSEDGPDPGPEPGPEGGARAEPESDPDAWCSRGDREEWWNQLEIEHSQDHWGGTVWC